MKRSEDTVRDEAGRILAFSDSDKALSGVGQITTFNTLGFPGVSDKPDGWYLPHNVNDVALILETKSSDKDLTDQRWINELTKNLDIVLRRYTKAVGILYNGNSTEVWKATAGGDASDNTYEHLDKQPPLQDKSHYLKLFDVDSIDKQRIYSLTKKINDRLHFDFRIKNLRHRMIFTACALVARRYGATFYDGMDFDEFHNKITSTLNKSLREARRQNDKLGVLIEVFSEIQMGLNVDDENPREERRIRELINDFNEWVAEISDCINSDAWRGEDVMGIFFNEFTRYQGKSDAGQVFTPEHITDFIYKALEVGPKDRVLDAACGSGGFLVKAMSNMIQAAGGVTTDQAKRIKKNQIFGIENDREIFALACANMLIHKDGKSNIVDYDSRYSTAGDWISEQKITKVLMNPPFERRYGCMDIVENVLNKVGDGVDCAFILPDKKLEKHGKKRMREILDKHTLKTVLKFPENLFFGVGVTTSLFIFRTGEPQNDREFMAAYMADDGLETVKNKGRHDIRGRWPEIEEKWLEILRKRTGDDTIQWNKPVISSCLSYQEPKQEFTVAEADFAKAALDYWAFSQDSDMKELRNGVADTVFYAGEVSAEEDAITISIARDTEDDA